MQVCIMRGLPGSGKSTKVKELLEEFRDTNPNGSAIVCSADDFFISAEDGEYHFDPSKIGQAHAWCKGQAYAAMKLGADLVVIDNTNTQRWEYEIYEQMALSRGYDVQHVRVGGLSDDDILLYADRNTHGVPLEAIQRMAKRFED